MSLCMNNVRIEDVVKALNDGVSHLRISNIAGVFGSSSLPKIALRHIEIGQDVEDKDTVLRFIVKSRMTLRVLDTGKSYLSHQLFWTVFHVIRLPFPQLYRLDGSVPRGGHYTPNMSMFPKLVFCSLECNVTYIRNGVPVEERMGDMFRLLRGNAAKLKGVVTLYLCMKRIGVPRDIRAYICEPMWSQQPPWVNAADLRLQPDDVVNHPNFRALYNAYERYTNAHAHYEVETNIFKKRKVSLQQALIDKNKAKIEYEKVLNS